MEFRLSRKNKNQKTKLKTKNHSTDSSISYREAGILEEISELINRLVAINMDRCAIHIYMYIYIYGRINSNYITNKRI